MERNAVLGIPSQELKKNKTMKKILLITALFAATFCNAQNVNTSIDTTRFLYTNGNLYKIKIYKVIRIDSTLMDSLMIVNELNNINGQVSGKDLQIQNSQTEKQMLNRRKNKLMIEAEKTTWF